MYIKELSHNAALILRKTDQDNVIQNAKRIHVE
jgi:hypothetical protein